MSSQGIAQILVYAVVLIGLSYPLGLYMARVYSTPRFGGRFLGSVERGFYRLIGARADREQDWKGYGKTALMLMLVFSVVVFALQRLQAHLFLNPDHLPAVPSHIALNTTASFVTNTNWQYYGGEYDHVVPDADGRAGDAALRLGRARHGGTRAVMRGLARRSATELGNFWVDLYRSLVYILLPLSIILAVVLITQGVPQTFAGHATAHTLEGAVQTIARGPVALMIAIKQLGTNGGGFYNSNSAVPFENPNGITNFLELISILLIPAAQVFMFGKMVLARRHAWMVFSSMFVLFLVGVAIALPAEQHGSQVLRASGVNITQGKRSERRQHGRQEVRFGIANTALWATATTDASNGSVDGGHDAFSPRSAAPFPLVNILVGEVIFGGVGQRPVRDALYIIIAVFVAGLMVGRTPEYLGKKIEAREIKYAAVGALFVPTMGADDDRGGGGHAREVSRRSTTPARTDSRSRSTRTTSQSNNNGSAFAGYGADELLRLARRGGDVPRPLHADFAALAIGGSLAAKKVVHRLGRDVPPTARRSSSCSSA